MRNSKRNGFTLVEAVVVIAIIGTLAAIAYPATAALIPGVRLRSGGQEVYRAIQSARMEAIKRNRNVYVEFETEARCGDSDVKPWTGVGYEIFYYTDKNKTDKTAITRGVLPALVTVCETGTTLPKVTNGASKKVARTSFKSNGLPNAMGTIHLRNTKKRHLYAVLADAGAVRVSNTKP